MLPASSSSAPGRPEGLSRTQRAVCFGSFSFDTNSLELRREGEPVHLPFQPGRVLCLLLSRPGELVTRAEIQAECWPETTFGVDPAMNAAVRQIRRALGESATHPEWIETLPRRGYRFIGEIERTGGIEARSGRLGSSRWVSPATVVLATAALTTLVVVISLVASTGATPARNNVVELSLDLRTELGKAEHLLALQDVAQLPRAVDLFAQVLAHRPDWAPARDGRASALFLLGERERARTEALASLRFDATSARAHHVLGLVQLVEDWDFVAAERSLRRARERDPAEQHYAVSLAFLLTGAGRDAEALAILREVREADPVEPAVRSDLGWMFFLLRRYEPAFELCDTAAELMPRAVWAEDCALGALVRLGREEEALRRARKAVARWGLADEAPAWPSSSDPRQGLEAYWAWRADRLSRRGPTGESRYLLATLLANLGREREAQEALAEALREHSLSAVAVAADPSFDGLSERPRLGSIEAGSAAARDS